MELVKPELLPEEIAVVIAALRIFLNRTCEETKRMSEAQRFAAANALEYFENEGTDNTGHPVLIETLHGETPRLVTVPNDQTLRLDWKHGESQAGNGQPNRW